MKLKPLILNLREHGVYTPFNIFPHLIRNRATLSGVGWETWNLPLVRRKLSLHVHSVVVTTVDGA